MEQITEYDIQSAMYLYMIVKLYFLISDFLLYRLQTYTVE